MFTPATLLNYFKFQYSNNSNGTRFKNTTIDKLPTLHYRFGEGNNWAATDLRVTAKQSEIQKWFDNYWETRPNPNSFVNQGLYEKELEEAILSAYNNLNEKWTKKLEKEFELEFQDETLGFFSGKKQNS
jgi:hypothetical protein